MKVLIVDDSNIIRRKIARIIKDSGIEEALVVGHAGDGEEAIKLCKQTAPDLITMDLTMPNLDGVECIKRIAEISPDTMILVVSALSDRPTCIKALHNGAHGFLQKPFTDEQLAESLKELIQ